MLVFCHSIEWLAYILTTGWFTFNQENTDNLYYRLFTKKCKKYVRRYLCLDEKYVVTCVQMTRERASE